MNKEMPIELSHSEYTDSHGKFYEAKYDPKGDYVLAAMILKPTEVKVGLGGDTLRGDIGDVLIKYGEGDYGVVAGEIFKETYQVKDESNWNLWYDMVRRQKLQSHRDRIAEHKYNNMTLTDLVDKYESVRGNGKVNIVTPDGEIKSFDVMPEDLYQKENLTINTLIHRKFKRDNMEFEKVHGVFAPKFSPGAALLDFKLNKAMKDGDSLRGYMVDGKFDLIDNESLSPLENASLSPLDIKKAKSALDFIEEKLRERGGAKKFNLMGERFLNPERKEMPDIDEIDERLEDIRRREMEARRVNRGIDDEWIKNKEREFAEKRKRDRDSRRERGFKPM